jgi:ABC-2 type transport system permease protein
VNELGALLFFVMSQLAAVIAVVVRTQGAIVGEKRNGTAEWVLSKPVSRKAFVLSKLVAHLGWLLIVTLLLPGAVFYLSMYSITSDLLPPLLFLGGVGMMALSLLFYLALSLLLGTVFESRGPLAGIVFSFMVTGFALTHFNVPQSVTSIFPWLLFEFGRFLVAGDQLPVAALTSIAATAAWAASFVALALWRFERVEF